MLAIHFILYAIEEYYGVTGDNKILCDNKGALYTFKADPSGSPKQQNPEGIKAGEEQNEKHTLTPPREGAPGRQQEKRGPP